MKGTLTEQPLAELIREILSKSLSGTLRLEHDRVQAAVYFENGAVVYAAANVRTLRLREYLIKRGLVSEAECASFGNNLSDLGLAAALRAQGKLNEKDLDEQMAAVVSDVLRVALLWTTGDWGFNPRARLDETTGLKIDCAALLKEAAHRLPVDFVALRFRNPGETFSRASDVAQASNILPPEGILLSRLDQPAKLEEVLALSKLAELDTYRVLYGLTLSGLVEREFWQNAFRTGTAKAPEPKPVAPAVPAPPPADNAEVIEVENFLQRLSQAVNYYEIIQLPTTADNDEIKNAYYALARRYHPDRFHLKAGTPLHAQISSAFARITQAYETLTDANARLVYDKAMERARQFAKTSAKPTASNTQKSRSDESGSDDAGPATESNRPEFNFREGVAALQVGRINAAITYLATASRLAPNEARYRAHYGRALAASEATRRSAEYEIKAAIKLEPQNALFRTMLAELYFDLGFHRRAQTEVEQALAIDPSSAPARALLRKLEKSRKVG
jgi:curved DNA-binding protein CbpA